VGIRTASGLDFFNPSGHFCKIARPLSFPSPPWFLQAHGVRLMPESCAGAPATALPNATRAPLIAQAFRLEWFTIAWMTIESAVALGAGIIACSISLTAFGIDSLIELASAGLLIWRLSVELKHGQSFSEKAERVASKIGGVMLFALAAYIIVAAGWGLWTREGEAFSWPGLVVTLLAIPTMYLLTKRKLAVAAKLGSRALRADAVEAFTCGWLSFVVVLGLLVQLILNAWWVDSVTSLAILWLVVKEGREAWKGEECCADD
jgi:divalent metal cation (Fe/Co/Zn/Cd) transporter